MEIVQRIIQAYSDRDDSTFDSNMYKTLRATEYWTKDSKTFIRFEAMIPEEYMNIRGTMHGGAICTYIDALTSIPMTMAHPDGKFPASVNLSVNVYAPIYRGEPIEAIAVSEKASKSIQIAKVTIYSRGRLVAKGSHIAVPVLPKL